MITTIIISYLAFGLISSIYLAWTWKGGKQDGETVKEIIGFSVFFPEIGFLVWLCWPVFLIIRIKNILKNKKTKHNNNHYTTYSKKSLSAQIKQKLLNDIIK